MSKINDDKIRLEFVINGDPARQELNKLDREAAKLKTQMRELKKGSDEYTRTEADLKKVTAEQRRLSSQLGINHMNLRELNTEAKRLRAMQQYMRPGTAEFKKVQTELTKVNARMRELRTGSKQTGISLKGMANSFNRYIGVVAGVTASFAGLIMGGRRAVEEYMNFEQALASLSSLTGLVGDELQWLGQQATEMSTSVLEGNIRITKSAEDIVNAYMVMGSQRPELLKNREALNAVTQDAIILSEASRMELEPSIRAVSMALNQFNLDGEESRRVINVIAAGSKAGAGDVQYITDALEKAGTTANIMNVSLEETVGAIETVAPFFAQASNAGNSFDKVLLQMRKQQIGYVNGVFSLESALEELDQRFKSGETSVDIFGLNHAKMADVLVSNRHEFTRYTEAVTGSNIAIEQATINTDTNLAKLEQARNSYKQRLREFGEMLAPVMTFSTNFFGYVMKVIIDITKNWDKYREILIALIAVYVAYNAQALIAYAQTLRTNAAIVVQNTLLKAKDILMKVGRASTLLFAAAQAQLTGNVGRANAAMRALRATMVGTPWGALLAGIVAVTAALVIYNRRKREGSELDKSYARMQKEVSQEYDKHAAEVMKLSSIIENANIPLERRQEAIEKLKEIMPEYNAYLNEEGELIGHNSEQIEKYLESLMKKLTFNALEAELQDLIERRIKAIRDLDKAETEYEQNQNYHAVRDRYYRQLEAAREYHDEVEEAIKQLTQDYERYTIELDSNTDSVQDNTEAIEANNQQLAQATELQDILKQKIQETDKAINDLTIRMRNAVYEGNFDLAIDLEQTRAELAALKKNLEAENVVVEGIVKFGGNVDAFLDNLGDDYEDQLDELSYFNELFWQNWGDTETESRQERFNREWDATQQMHQEKMLAEKERLAWEEEQHRQSMERRKELYIGIFGEINNAGQQIYFDRLRHNMDVEMAQLNESRDRQLENENLTQQQRQQITEQFRQREANLKRQQFIRERNAKAVMAVINTALGVTEAIPDPFRMTLAGVAGGLQTATILAQPVPQYSKGKYKVIGENDRRTYDATWIGKPKTGLYSRPALFAETGGEIIIDPLTTKNIVANHPQILNAIHAAKVPQYNTGTPIPQATAQPSQNNTELSLETIQRFEAAVILFDRVSKRLDSKGIKAHILMSDILSSIDDYNNTTDQANPF